MKTFLAPAVAVALLLVIGVQTSDALRRSGSWGGKTQAPKTPPVDPYAGLESQLSRTDPGLPAIGLRDPFSFYSAPRVVQAATPRGPRTPPPPPRPVLTAVLMDDDPRALLQYQERNYSVKAGDLFAEFRVVSIDREQVVLEGRGQRMTLRRPTKGE